MLIIHGAKPGHSIEGLAEQFGDTPAQRKEIVYLGITKEPETGNMAFWLSKGRYWICHQDRAIVLSGERVEYRCYNGSYNPEEQCNRDEAAWLAICHAEGRYTTHNVNLRE